MEVVDNPVDVGRRPKSIYRDFARVRYDLGTDDGAKKDGGAEDSTNIQNYSSHGT
jgi:hypothetical protein